MKRLLFAITLLTSLNQLNAQAWHNVGPVGIPVATNAGESDFIIAADGTPYVFYISNGTSKGTVKKWDGTNWITFGPTDFTDAFAYNIRLESYGSSVFVSYYLYNGGYDQIKVFEVTATGTSDLSSYIGQGVILTNPTNDYDFNVSPNGEIQLAFFENYWTNQFIYAIWNGTTFDDPYNYLPSYTSGGVQIETDMFGNDWVMVHQSIQVDLLKRNGNAWNVEETMFQGGPTYNKLDLAYSYDFGGADVRVTGMTAQGGGMAAYLAQYENDAASVANSGVIGNNADYFDIASDSNNTWIYTSEGQAGGNALVAYMDHATHNVIPALHPFLGVYTSPQIELKANGEPVVSYVDASGSLWVIESWQNVSFTCQNLTTCGGTTEVFSGVINVTSENLDNNDLTWGITPSNTGIVPVASVVSGTYPNYDVLLTTNKVYNANLPVTLTISVEDELGVGNQTSNHNLSVKYVDSLINYFTATSVCSNSGPIDFNDYVYPLGGNFTGIPSTGVVNPATSGNPVTFSYSTISAVGCYNQMNIGFAIDAAPSASVNVTNAGCADSTGTATVTASGGTAPYTYYWNTGADSVNIADLPAGQYFVTVTDNKGCMATGVGNVGNTSVNLMATANGVNCPGDNNGSIDLTVAGVGPFDILWSNGYWTEDVTGLEPGFYDVTVTDANGCEATGTYEVTGPSDFDVSESVTASACGSATGGITLTVSGGTGTLDYQWYDSGSNAIGTNSNAISSIGGGSYSVEISDANGCTYTYNTTVSEAGAPTVTVDQVVKATCANDGAINITITGTPTSINWSNGATTEDISGLAPGTYTVTVLDAGGCQSIKNVTVNPQLPATPQICVVTVDSITTTNVVVWEKPVTTNISHYNIYREGSQAGQYLKIDSVLYSEDSEFNDLVASPMVRSWRYKISAVDNCGNESAKSAYHKTIHATINLGLGSNINILWDSYEGLSYS
ncbi:MAG: SprB repeat-containing protein, partial [Crocinitomicaceae bacterium]|nr:SprB repeat-containing protein [Crocinitomicaceae bacterium]